MTTINLLDSVQELKTQKLNSIDNSSRACELSGNFPVIDNKYLQDRMDKSFWVRNWGAFIQLSFDADSYSKEKYRKLHPYESCDEKGMVTNNYSKRVPLNYNWFANLWSWTRYYDSFFDPYPLRWNNVDVSLSWNLLSYVALNWGIDHIKDNNHVASSFSRKEDHKERKYEILYNAIKKCDVNDYKGVVPQHIENSYKENWKKFDKLLVLYPETWSLDVSKSVMQLEKDLSIRALSETLYESKAIRKIKEQKEFKDILIKEAKKNIDKMYTEEEKKKIDVEKMDIATISRIANWKKATVQSVLEDPILVWVLEWHDHYYVIDFRLRDISIQDMQVKFLKNVSNIEVGNVETKSLEIIDM